MRLEARESRENEEGIKSFGRDRSGVFIGKTDGSVPSDLTVQIYRRSGFNGEDFATVGAKISELTIPANLGFPDTKIFLKQNSLNATENFDKS